MKGNHYGFVFWFSKKKGAKETKVSFQIEAWWKEEIPRIVTEGEVGSLV